ncbi:MAG: lipase family protein [Ferruginibacter sp.]|nr:lipase family protein [Ferruginibacter sp.]
MEPKITGPSPGVAEFIPDKIYNYRVSFLTLFLFTIQKNLSRKTNTLLSKQTIPMSIMDQEKIQQSLAALKTNPALSQHDFGNIVRAFALHPEQDRFLLETNLYNEKLAETLLVFRKRIAEATRQGKDLTQLIDRLFLHYIVNTTGPILEAEDSDPFDVVEAATRYAGLLNVGMTRDTEGNSILNIDGKDVTCPRWERIPGLSSAYTLRTIGPVINRARYGRDDVIPSNAFGFDEDATGHTLENAITMAELAHIAYFTPAFVEKQLADWGYHSFKWIENAETDTQVFLAGKDEHLVISFRGTSSWKDALADLNFLKTEAFGGIGKVHRGFQRALDGVWSEVQAAVDSMGAKKKLFICGHSLGAALAQLAAHRLALGKYNVAHIYVFGSPRVANREFVACYNELLEAKTFLHINNRDIVTTIPLKLLGFHHLGGEPRSFNNGHVISNMTEAIEATAATNRETEFEQLDLETQEKIRQQMYEVEQSIQASTRFLTSDPNRLSAGSYATQFESGAADEHGMDQYLFKFACALVDGAWVRIGKGAATLAS